MGLLEKLQAKLELYRLEQRYTRRSKRTTFVSEAQYVDGEYVYASSSPKSSSAASASSNASSAGSAGSAGGRWGKAPVVWIKDLARGGAERL